MLDNILDIALTAAAATAMAIAPIIVPPLRRWLISTARLEKIIGDGELAKRLDAGVINLIRNATLELQTVAGRKTVKDSDILDLATQKTQRQFPETLQKLGMNGVQTREYVKARIQAAATERDHLDR
jgi:hypothetical protein